MIGVGPSTHVRRAAASGIAAFLALSGLAGPGCHAKKDGDPVRRAQFGVFYGGDIQEREAIPFELNQAKQTHGIRIEFASPLVAPALVEWEFDMPGSGRRIRDAAGKVGAGRWTQVDRAEVPAGRSSFEQVFAFRPGDALGTWHVVVRVNQREVIRRSILIYDRSRPPAPDAGT